jgi:sugar porter (SP) family MFS transporter
VVRGNEAFNEAMIKEPPRPFSAVSVVLYFCCLVGFLCSTMNGYDGSLLNGLLSNSAFKTYFNGTNDGLWAGIVSSIYQIGGVVALPFVGPALDTWGRRVGMFFGASLIVLGTIIQGTTSVTHSLGQFMGGRFLLGFGVSLAASAGPIYVVEVCHPAYRGVVTGLYNTFWFTGSIVSSGAARGALNLGGNASWLIPVWLQLLFSGFICIFCLWLPESPRWLYVNNKIDKSTAMLTKYHGDGDSNSIWVSLQLREYDEFLNLNGADKRWWDYSALFRSRGSCYRLACNVIISIFGQWAGNGLVSYFFSAVLSTAGVKDDLTQLNYNLGYACWQFFFAICGALVVDRVGRRPLLLFTNIACTLTWIAVSISSSQYFATQSVAAAKAVIGFIFIFGAVYSVGFTPLQALYPVEVLSFEMRAKGMAFSNLAVNAAGLLNQFAWPVAIANITWKTYIVFTVWCAIQATVIYFMIPETKNRTVSFRACPLSRPMLICSLARRTRRDLCRQEPAQGVAGEEEDCARFVGQHCACRKCLEVRKWLDSASFRFVSTRRV